MTYFAPTACRTSTLSPHAEAMIDRLSSRSILINYGYRKRNTAADFRSDLVFAASLCGKFGQTVNNWATARNPRFGPVQSHRPRGRCRERRSSTVHRTGRRRHSWVGNAGSNDGSRLVGVEYFAPVISNGSPWFGHTPQRCLIVNPATAPLRSHLIPTSLKTCFASSVTSRHFKDLMGPISDAVAKFVESNLARAVPSSRISP
jgi:hypothetical protein